jgi:hypothetical protein
MHTCYYLIFMSKFIDCLVNHGVVLLLCVVSLMAGPTTGVLMVIPMVIPNRNAVALLPKSNLRMTSYCTKVYKYYTTKAPESTTHAAPIHYIDVLKYYSAPSYYTTKATEQDCACCRILLHQGSQV